MDSFEVGSGYKAIILQVLQLFLLGKISLFELDVERFGQQTIQE